MCPKIALGPNLSPAEMVKMTVLERKSSCIYTLPIIFGKGMEIAFSYCSRLRWDASATGEVLIN